MRISKATPLAIRLSLKSHKGVTRLTNERAIWLAKMICIHEPALRRWLGRHASKGFEIDDIVQESYAKLATLPSVAHIANPRAYLFRTAFSILVNEVRRAQVVPIDAMADLDRLEIQSHEPGPDLEAEGRQELRIVAEAIAQLPPRCREAFVLRKVQGLSQREIATRLGIAESTVEKHISAGFRHLIANLGHGGTDGVRVSTIQTPATEPYAETRNER